MLNLKAQFLTKVPDLKILKHNLTYLNLSFNCLVVFPKQILQLRHLTVLKLRNNPLKEIPIGIKKLRRLRQLTVSYCLLSSLPMSIFSLSRLVILGLAYNLLTFIPEDIGCLSSLKDLDLEGNQLGALPASILRLQSLKYLRMHNNFTHPIFWSETISFQPQSLVDMSILAVTKHALHRFSSLPPKIKSLLNNVLTCDCCGGPRFGEGVRVIKGAGEIFWVKNLPLLFTACSQTCRRKFKRNADAIPEWLTRNKLTLQTQMTYEEEPTPRAKTA